MVVVTPSAGFFRFLSAEHLKAGVLMAVMNRLRLLKIPVRKSQSGNPSSEINGRCSQENAVHRVDSGNVADGPISRSQGWRLPACVHGFSRRTFKSSG